jgi:hypothetical protein
MMRELFIGKPAHWLIWIVIVPVLFAMSRVHLQVRHFNLFLAVVFLLGTGAVLAVLLTSRAGERVTREPFEDADWQQSSQDE